MRVGDDRPLSELLVDLHVYIVPPNLWQEQLHSASNEIISNTVSAGFLRVHPETTVISLREEMPKQIGFELLPPDYVFLKSVGRCLTRVKAKQERQMKVKHFLPPHAYCPEIFLMEPTLAMRNMISSDDESGRQSYEQTSRSRVSVRNGSKASQHGIYDKRVQQNGGSHMDSGFGRDSLSHVNDHALESPKRTQRAHFDESGSGSGTDEDHHAQDRRRSSQRSKASSKHGDHLRHAAESPAKSKKSLSPDRAGSKRPSYQDDTDNGVTSRRQSVGVVSPSSRKSYHDVTSGADGNDEYDGEYRSRRGSHKSSQDRSPRGAPTPGGRSHADSPHSKSDRSRHPSQRHKHDTPQPNSDEEFAEQLGASEPVTMEEQHRNLKEQLEKIRQERKNLEIKREEMVKKAKYLQSKTTSRRNQARDVWKKRYFEEKKKTPPLEEKSNRLRMDLEGLHRKIVGQMEGVSTSSRNPGAEPQKVLKPSRQNNLRINATKLNHEIEELQRRVDDAKMKLTGEVKLRNQAESELRALRAELTQRKINVTLTRTQRLEGMQMEQAMLQKRAASPVGGFDGM